MIALGTLLAATWAIEMLNCISPSDRGWFVAAILMWIQIEGLIIWSKRSRRRPRNEGDGWRDDNVPDVWS
jgi:hypothetical protein